MRQPKEKTHRTRPNWRLPKDMINLVALVAAAHGKLPGVLVEEILRTSLRPAIKTLEEMK